MPAALSIVIVSFRSRPVLGPCLEALRLACDPGLPCEILVVDNASGDGTPDWLRTQFPEAAVLENASNLGFGRACNQGLACAAGHHTLFLNPDTELPRGALSRLVERLEREARPGLISPRLEGGGPPAWGRFPTLRRLLSHRLGLGIGSEPGEGPVDWVLGACMLGRTEVLRELGGFDEDYFLYGEDLDLCDRMAAVGRTVVYYPSVTVIHRGNDHWDEQRLRRVHSALLMFFRKRRGLPTYLAASLGLRLLELWRSEA